MPSGGHTEAGVTLFLRMTAGCRGGSALLGPVVYRAKLNTSPPSVLKNRGQHQPFTGQHLPWNSLADICLTLIGQTSLVVPLTALEAGTVFTPLVIVRKQIGEGI